ncbi:hypothetical protein [Proteiniclasticum sp. QWL-01]|uniref:hypothetical protein n=1 Tax=Proteiniclasticum sp. QWL-01 TaxID=3036945 RepID=UPI00240EB7E1|nr:hypothetical protein [Proteiniclasticum sp. QWL-01]WFF72005.1 hypothetical protein P6M73_11930 [Proteiniclasticum sp. QWL-01]
MSKKELIVKALEAAELSDIEIIKEEDGLTLVRFYYDFDEDELTAAQKFAESEEEEESFDDGPAEDMDDEAEEESDLGDVLDEIEEEDLGDVLDEIEEEDLTDEDLTYDEEDEFLGDARQKYLSEIAIDHVGEILEEIQDDLEMEVQYVGYDMDDEEYESYEFVALIFEKGKGLNIEDILDELDI